MQHGSDKTLEERLTLLGKSLTKPPSSQKELLRLLNQIDKHLVCVEQSPSTSMQAALSPLMKAIAGDELLNHSNDEIKAGVAACICEITRITAPDAPYDDEKMKVVFQLIISSFEKLSDLPSRSLQRKASILETVAKVRSCVILLDLECDQLILEMFKNFFKAIRPYHEEIIIVSMEAIMTLVLEESEEISADLINLILSTLRKDNEVDPIAKNLAERIIQNTSDKLRPHLAEAVKSLNSSLEDYCETVALICNEKPSLEHSNESILKYQTKEDGNAESIQHQKNLATAQAPMSAVSNGSNEIRSKLNTQAVISSKPKPNNLSNAKSTHGSEMDNLDPEGPVIPDAKSDCVEAKKTPDSHEITTDSVRVCPAVVKSSKQGKSIAARKESIMSSPSQASENEAVEATLPTQGSIVDVSQSDREGSPVERECSKKKPISDDQKVSEGDNLSEGKHQKSSKGRQVDKVSNKRKGSSDEGAHKSDGGSASNSEAVSVDQRIAANSVKVEGESLSMKDSRENGGGTTSGAGSESVVQKRKRGRPRLDRSKLSTGEDHVKEKSSSSALSKSKGDEVINERTPRINSKGKQIVETEKGSESMEYREDLIGLKIKVWWPKDQMFYEGVVASFDSAKKRHKVLYTDGDMEILNLQKQKWEYVKDELVSDEEKEVEHSNDHAPDMQKKRKRNSILSTSRKRRKSEDSPKMEDKESPIEDVKCTPESKSGKQGGSGNASNEDTSSRSHKKQDKEESKSGKTTNSCSTTKVKGEGDVEKIKGKNIEISKQETTKSSKKRRR